MDIRRRPVLPLAAAVLAASVLAGLGGGALGRQPWTAGTAAEDGAAKAHRDDVAFSPRAELAGRYQARILRVIDGDTVEARVRVWLGHEVVTKVRLRGIDAPEVAGACGAERERALAAKARLESLVENADVVLERVGGDKFFGRVVAEIVTARGEEAGRALLAAGLARPYGGGRRATWCDLSARR